MRLLAVVHGKGALPLGSKCGNVQSTFDTGRHMDKEGSGGARRASGGNHANSAPSKGGKVGLNFSNKDGQRQAGNPAKSASSRGPAGIRSKKGRPK